MEHACIGMRRFQEWRRPGVREYSTGNTDGTTAMTCANGVGDDEEATKRSTEDRGRVRKWESKANTQQQKQPLFLRVR
ncbi:unnamed protein product [Sphagnum jensenii]|uniref:Uncharacterized protein n=1 Tax=Sphagnum jensenii TaxID=128206 RepID=A0ABP0X309_9BRYO